MAVRVKIPEEMIEFIKTFGSGVNDNGIEYWCFPFWVDAGGFVSPFKDAMPEDVDNRIIEKPIRQ